MIVPTKGDNTEHLTKGEMMVTITRVVKIGDHIKWRGGFGDNIPLDAVIVGMEVTEQPRTKHGEQVIEVNSDLIEQNRVLFDLDNGHWCYSEQIELYDNTEQRIMGLPRRLRR